MPKIPTFEAQQRITTQVPSVASQFQIPVEKAGSQFGAIAGALDAASEYYAREQAIKDKTEATKNYLELLRARYVLQDRILEIRMPDVNTYEIIFKKKNKPWVLPIVYTYVVQHQKHVMNELLRELKPIAVYVDSIELEEKSPLLDNKIGKTFKYESISKNQTIFKLDPPKSLKAKNPYKYFPLAKRMIIQGAAGSGKTHLLQQLARSYLEASFSASTNKAARILNRKGINASTYHKTFFGRSPNNLVHFIDEASMMSQADFDIVDEDQPNSKLILIGDLCQLRPVNGKLIDITSMHKLTLEQNYRQISDPKFYKLCNLLRDSVTVKQRTKILYIE